MSLIEHHETRRERCFLSKSDVKAKRNLKKKKNMSKIIYKL